MMKYIWNQTLFKRAILFLIIAVSITILVTAVTYIINPDIESVIAGVDERLPDELKEATGIHKVWEFVVNNGFKVPLQMFILSLLPIPFLYAVNIIVSVALPGVLFGVVLQEAFGQGVGVILSSMPHFVVEVFAFCIFAAMLFEWNQVVRAKIKTIFKKNRDRLSVSNSFIDTVKVYALFVLPLIIIAAFLETYVADMIFATINR